MTPSLRLALAVSTLAFAPAIAAADPEPLGPAPEGSLRVDLHCADYWATPDHGLRVQIDGAPAEATGVNGATVLVEGRRGVYTGWAPTDVGFDVAPGPHRVAVAAPDCAGVTSDVTVSADRPTYITGRLAVVDPSLLGTTAAPNGLGFALGATALPITARSGTTTLGSESTDYASDAATAAGFWASSTFERRHLAVAVDTAFAHATATGRLHATGAPDAMSYADSVMDMASEVRVGGRVPLRFAALAAGTGLGLDVTSHTATLASDAGFVVPPNGMTAAIFVPVWAAVELKPTCDLGVELLASDEIRGGAAITNHVAFAAGILWQPSRACSERAGVRVH